MNSRSMQVRLIVAAIAATIAIFLGVDGKAIAERRVVIEIRDFEFRPERPTLAVGDVVIWKNFDIVPHTATAIDGSWDSGAIPAGAEFSMRISDDMVEAYFCTYHPTMTAALRIAPE